MFEAGFKVLSSNVLKKNPKIKRLSWLKGEKF
jgi:hypothetical protein